MQLHQWLMYLHQPVMELHQRVMESPQRVMECHRGLMEFPRGLRDLSQRPATFSGPERQIPALLGTPTVRRVLVRDWAGR